MFRLQRLYRNIIHSFSKHVEVCSILVAKILVIGEATQMNLWSKTVSVTLRLQSLPKQVNWKPRQIFNLVKDSKSLSRYIKSIKFVYCSKSASILADRLANIAPG